MAILIGRVRRSLGDAPASVWADEDVQGYLDDNRMLLRFARIVPLRSFGPGGIALYQEFVTPKGGGDSGGGLPLLPQFVASDEGDERWGDWEDGAVIYDAVYGAVAGANYLMDSRTGKVTFAVPQTNIVYYVSGQVYDVHGACADALTEHLGTLRLSYDFKSQEKSFSRSQQLAGTQKAIEHHAARRWAKCAIPGRSDAN